MDTDKILWASRSVAMDWVVDEAYFFCYDMFRGLTLQKEEYYAIWDNL